MSERKRFLTKQEAAEELGTTPRTINRLISEGELSVFKLSNSRMGRVHIPREDLEAFIERNTAKADR